MADLHGTIPFDKLGIFCCFHPSFEFKVTERKAFRSDDE